MSINHLDITSYNNIIELNYEPIVNNYPTIEPTEYNPILIKNNSCNCDEERNICNKNLIIIASTFSSSTFLLLVILLWYKFIYKKKIFNYKSDDNFGIIYEQS